MQGGVRRLRGVLVESTPDCGADLSAGVLTLDVVVCVVLMLLIGEQHSPHLGDGTVRSVVGTIVGAVALFRFRRLEAGGRAASPPSGGSWGW